MVEARAIAAKARELGFSGCGIVPIEALKEFEGRLEQRIRECPASKGVLEPLRRYASPGTTYPWARAVVVTATDYSRFRVPRELQGRIGKYYLFDHKQQPAAPGSGRIAAFERELDAMGVRWVKELHGVTSARFAAEKAGLGIMRLNNFLCTKVGSRVILDTWLIGAAAEWTEACSLPPCPAGCRRCIDACPTGALSEPHRMDASRCITLWSWGARDLPSPEAAARAGSWVYGCDACQDACPLNAPVGHGAEDYPGLEALAGCLTLQGIIGMDEAAMKETLLPRFWFIPPDRFWLWKVNALRAMGNDYRPEYRESIERATNDADARVREMAERVAAERGIPPQPPRSPPRAVWRDNKAATP